MNIRELKTAIEAVDRRRRFVRIDLPREWSRRAGDMTIGLDGYPTDETIRVQSLGPLRFPPAPCRVVDPDDCERPVTLGQSETITPSTRLVVEAPVTTLIRLPSGGTVRHTSDEVTVTPTDEAILGWHPVEKAQYDNIRVNNTPEGIAAGIEALTTALPDVTTPGRTWPNSRTDHPPTFSISGEGTPPEDVDRPATAVSLVLPEDEALAYLTTTAPLAVYTAADIYLSATEIARLETATESWELGNNPSTVDTVSSRWFQTTFWLDCHARAPSPPGTELRGADEAFQYLNRSASELADTPLAERVDAYLRALERAGGELEAALPKWPHSVHVEPTMERLRRLGIHAGRLADVRLPSGEPLTTVGERAQWAESNRVRGPIDAVIGSDHTTVAPDAETETVGWDAPGRVVGAYEWTGDTPEPRADHGSEIRVTVVQCDGQPVAETIDRWRIREADLPLTVRVVQNPTVERLRTELTRPTDVMQIGAHHDQDGIDCADGALSAGETAQLDVHADVVVANCCDSLSWSKSAVEAGAVAGVGTTGPVPVELASEVGGHLAGLLSLGWTVERAADVVRRASVPAGYVVIGDGLYRPTQSDSLALPIFEVDTNEQIIRVSQQGPRSPGYRVCLPGESPTLPQKAEVPLTEPRRKRLAKTSESAIIVDGSITWDGFDAGEVKNATR